MSSIPSSSPTTTKSPTPSRSLTSSTRKASSSTRKSSTSKPPPTTVRSFTTSTSITLTTDLLTTTISSSLESFTSTTTSSISETPEPTAETTITTPQPVHNRLNGAEKAGIGIGAAIGVAMLVVAAYLIGARRWKKRNPPVPAHTNGFTPPYGPTHPAEFKAPVQYYNSNPAFTVTQSPMPNSSYPNDQIANFPYPGSPQSTTVYPSSPNSANTNSINLNTAHNSMIYTNMDMYTQVQPTSRASEYSIPTSAGSDTQLVAASQRGAPQLVELSAEQTPRLSRLVIVTPDSNGETPDPTTQGTQDSQGQAPPVQNTQQTGDTEKPKLTKYA